MDKYNCLFWNNFESILKKETHTKILDKII